jgi:hypothetical protein
MKSFMWFALYQKSATEISWWLYIRLLESELIKFKTRRLETVIGSWNMWLFLYVYKCNCKLCDVTVHDFYNIIFKIKLHIASESAPPPNGTFWVCTWSWSWIFVVKYNCKLYETEAEPCSKVINHFRRVVYELSLSWLGLLQQNA